MPFRRGTILDRAADIGIGGIELTHQFRTIGSGILQLQAGSRVPSGPQEGQRDEDLLLTEAEGAYGVLREADSEACQGA